jgi:uncharacterized membrane protein
MYRRNLDILIVSILGLVPLGLVLLGVNDVAGRLVFALLLTFLLPGYALQAAMITTPTLGKAERLLLSLGLSLAVAILGGFILNLTAWGLRTSSWAVWLGAITVAGCLAAMVRRHGIRAASRPGPPQFHGFAQLVPLGLAGLMVIAAVVIVVRSVMLASDFAARYPALEVVQLWALPETVNGQITLHVGIATRQAETATYRLRLQQGGQLLREWPTITLSAGEQWEIRVTLPGNLTDAVPVDALLYRQGAPVAYRHVQVWLNANSH